ncbi:MAG: hypothetical protein DMF89_13125 [Acidobacteria bacterium]|nr:MAG: hypothetical protein DMF89_13125 [Acidobacteriota bacterium]
MRQALVVVALLAGTVSALAQGQRFRYAEPIRPNAPYDGKFTFVRLRYGPPTQYAMQRIPWSHDYPTGERHFMQIMNEVTLLAPHIEETNIHALNDPELFRHPVAYMAEPGFWTLTETEAASFRAYLQKGGFVIFDDFAENRGGWGYFAAQMSHVLPEGRWVELDGTHPIFHSFFEIPAPEKFEPPYDRSFRPVYLGMFENNDPAKRLIAIANYNNDISEYWEFSDTGFAPVSDTNEAYKLGVNYIIYAMTH